MHLADIEVEIKRYRPQAGDVLIVTPSRPLNEREMRRAADILTDLFGDSGVRVLVADRGMTIGVLRAEASGG